LLSSCATIITGGSEDIRVNTQPGEAKVQVYNDDGSLKGEFISPCKFTLKKGDGYFQGASYRMVITKEGFEKREVIIDSHLNGGWYILGNFVFGGLIGWLIVDPLSGGMWTLRPQNIRHDFIKSATKADMNLDILLKQDVTNKTLPMPQNLDGE
jgi:hypothetical protein